jgi:hypothetical protein
MVPQGSLIVMLWQLIDRLPVASSPSSRRAGHLQQYSDRLFLKALVLMIVNHLHRVNEMLQVLQQPALEMQTLHRLLEEKGRCPSPSTFERRLAALPDTLPAQIRTQALSQSGMRKANPARNHNKYQQLTRTIMTKLHLIRQCVNRSVVS